MHCLRHHLFPRAGGAGDQRVRLGRAQGADQAAKVDGYNRVQSSLDEVRTARRQASLAEAQDRNRGQDR